MSGMPEGEKIWACYQIVKGWQYLQPLVGKRLIGLPKIVGAMTPMAPPAVPASLYVYYLGKITLSSGGSVAWSLNA